MARHWIVHSLALILLAALGSVQLTAEEPQGAKGDAQSVAKAGDLSAAFKKIARDSRPAVVSIRAVKRVVVRSSSPKQIPRSPGGISPRDFFNDDFFEHFFEFRQPEGSYEQRGQGSGVIVREDGYVLTNHHLVGDADEVTVTLADKRELAGKVVGTDKLTDVAVLKLDAKGLPFARLGDSNQLEVGEWVLAFGSPFGLEQTVTAGIISAKGRAHVGITAYEDFLQTDAAINPGNSGGPLVNLNGEVIGINTAIASRTGGYMGVGFAIPSHQAREVMQSIIKDGRVTRGWLGAAIQDLTSELAKSFHFDSTAGVLIGDVTPQSPAEKAGLKAGDILVRFNGHPVSEANRLRNTVAATAPQSKVEIELFRDGKPLKLSVTIGTLDDGAQVAAAAKESPAVLGLTVETMTPEIAKQLGLADERGAVVTSVQSGSLADQAGISPGDLVIAVDNHPVHSATDFQAAFRDRDLSRGVRLQLKREGVKRFVFLRGSP